MADPSTKPGGGFAAFGGNTQPSAGPSRLRKGPSIDLTGGSDDEMDVPTPALTSSAQVHTGLQGVGVGVENGARTTTYPSNSSTLPSSILPSSSPHLASLHYQAADPSVARGPGTNYTSKESSPGDIEITGQKIVASPLPRQPVIHPPQPHQFGVNGFSSPGPSSLPAGYHHTYAPSLPYPAHQFSTVPGMSSSPLLNQPYQATMNPTLSRTPSFTPTGLSTPALPSNGAGSTSASAIDLDAMRIPSPPPSDAKRAICIGALISRAIMLYPSTATTIGAMPKPGSKEHWEIVPFRGAEFIKVKLKYRAKGSKIKQDDPWTSIAEDCIQVRTPNLHNYLGDLDQNLASILMPHLKKGLLRLEGFAQRLQPEAPQYELKLNVLLFTLPSNISYIAQSLIVNQQYLLDPIPTYDPSRHSDNPPYVNAHGGQEQAMRMWQLAHARMRGAVSYNNSLGPAMDKATQVEVQRQQVDEVFKALDSGQEMEQSDPGPLIKTNLFPHQRKALTFMLEREADWPSLRRARKYADKRLRKARAAAAAGETEEKEKEAEEKVKMRDVTRMLWEPQQDDKGKTRSYKNKITQEIRKTKKGENPNDTKGAILADDMGLGKTLSVVSLIASTREAAKKWGKSKLAASTTGSPAKSDDGKNGTTNGADIKATEFKGRVFGMPSVESDDESTTKGKKRKRDAVDKKLTDTRQSLLRRRSKATLLVCPMSTITNWEDQIKEHWNGKVDIVGGAAGIQPAKDVVKTWRPPKKGDESSDSDDESNYDVLRVYIYHGSARRAEVGYIGDFDVVITSYNTLAQEFSKLNLSGMGEETAENTESNTPAETAGNSDEDGTFGDTSLNTRATNPEVEAEIKATEVADALRKSAAKKGKGKGKALPKATDQLSPLQAIEWFRVVLDEAHYIKSASTVASRASCYLAADRRICLTGTPIQNKIEDVWALFKFLRLDPIDRKEVFNEFIWNPCKAGDTIGVAKLQLVMRCCTLRRTKDSTAEDGKRILNLPPRKEMQLWLDLRPDERAIYDARKQSIKETVGDLAAQNELTKNYAHVLQEVLRLRQICDHVDLAMTGAVEEDYDGTIMDYSVAIKGIEANGLSLARAQSVVAFLKDGAGALCTACNFDYGECFPGLALIEKDQQDKLKKLPHRPILTKCLHLFCPKCFASTTYADLSKRNKEVTGRACGACSAPLRIPSDVIEVVPPDTPEAAEAAEAAQAAAKRYHRKKFVRAPGEALSLSTKMSYLQTELMDASRKNPNSVHYDPMALAEDVEELDSDGRPLVVKSVVFSQWTTMLDRIGDMLDEINIKYARLDGTMTREERAKAVEALRRNKKVEVLLVSTRAGGVGLNLTAACRCFLVDPYWNPSVESQAIDRIHRMGQTRPVTAIKLMINDSIEMKLDEIQKKKANMAQLSLKNMSRKEIMEQKAEELASLFS